VILRSINFSPVFAAAGVRGFFGEGYWYHSLWKLLGMTFSDCGFIAKTTTLNPQAGNLPLKNDGITPKEWLPRCIIVKPIQGVVLNAVGLSGPGAKTLLEDGRWQQINHQPFFLSFMSTAKNPADRLAELQEFVTMLHKHQPRFQTPFGLEINFSCPNAGLNPAELLNEVNEAFDFADGLGIPLQGKFNATVSPDLVCEVCQNPACDAITMSNTIPWGKCPDCIDWCKLFGSDISPLARFNGGGLSGWPLLPLVSAWIKRARLIGFKKPIWACGGIDSCSAIDRVRNAGASGIQLGTVAMLRPWRMCRLIHYANNVFD
jgi:dihydroorotate dehydrogenase